MKRILALVFVCVAGSCAAAGSAVSAAATTPAANAHAAKLQALRAAQLAAKKRVQLSQLAPADEYFGPLKLSIIGINNTIHDLGLRYDYNHDLGDRTYASAQLAERAVRDWASRYPHDDQLPHSIFILQRLYTKILTITSRDRAHVVALWMFSSFGASPQARQLHKTLSAEHLAPISSTSSAPDTQTAPAAAVTPMSSPTDAVASSAPATMNVPSPAGIIASPAAPLGATPASATPTGTASVAPASPAASPLASPAAAPSAAISPLASPAAGPTSTAAPQSTHAP